jgi:cytochrome c551
MQSKIHGEQLPLKGILLILCISVVIITSCNKKDNGNTLDQSTKFSQYFNQGEELYLKNCSNCHQKNGTGLGQLYPPLHQSDYLQQNLDSVICLIKNGKSGVLIVNGKNFNKAMPAIPSLTDIEIAEITTYLYNTWNNKKGIIEVKYVSKILNECGKKD